MLTRYSTTIISTTNNQPISSGRLAFYDHITSDPVTAYSDEDGVVNITNVVPADTYGRVECFLYGGIYDIQVRNAADSVLYTLTAVLISDSAVSILTDIGKNLLVVETPVATKFVTVEDDGAVVLVDTPSSATTWGSITGTLSSQTDLQTALNGKASSTANISIFTNDSGYLTSITSKSIKDLSDVYDSMSPTDGQVLTYDTTNGWQAETPSGGSGPVSYLYTDTPVANPSGSGAGSLIIGDAAVGNNGTDLVIIGNNTTSATGKTKNVVIGNTLTITGSYNFLGGYNSTCDGDNLINIGRSQDLDSGSTDSCVYGNANYAISAVNATIIGKSNNLTGTNSSAVGSGNTVNYDTGSAFGYANTCDASGTSVLGNSCWAETADTLSIGHLSGINGASATDSIAVGNRAQVSHANSMVIASSSANVSSSAASSIKLATSATNYVEYVGGALKIVGTNAVFQLPSYTTAGRPTGISAGAHIFDSTLGYAITYNGSVWKDGVGTTV